MHPCAGDLHTWYMAPLVPRVAKRQLSEAEVRGQSWMAGLGNVRTAVGSPYGEPRDRERDVEGGGFLSLVS